MRDLTTTAAETDPSPTMTLAGWAASLTLDSVPPAIIERAKDCILDSLGCLIGGTAVEPCRVLRAVLARHDGAGETTVPGTGRRLPLLAAVYHGAQAANALDFDDSFRDGAPSHPGATVVPTALALGESLRAGGADLIRATIVGYEVSLRIGRAIQPTPARKAEIYGFATWQTFGATAAAAALLGLDRERIVHAFGIAGVQAPVPSLRKLGTGEPPPLPWTKNPYGRAAESGTLAALLAAEGYVGSRTMFDEPHSFWLMAGSDRYRPALLTEGLGTAWLLDGVGFKHYGCCRWTHTMLDVLAELRAAVRPTDVAAVEVFAFDELVGLDGALPTSIVDAQFHAPYLAALELLGRSPSGGLGQDDLGDPAVLALAGRVQLRHDPALDAAFYGRGALPVRVRLTTADGAVHEAAREDPTGSQAAGGYARPALRDKFLRLAAPQIGADNAKHAVTRIEALERQDLAELARLIA